MKKLFYTLAIAAFALMSIACNRTSEIKVMLYDITLISDVRLQAMLIRAKAAIANEIGRASCRERV